MSRIIEEGKGLVRPIQYHWLAYLRTTSEARVDPGRPDQFCTVSRRTLPSPSLRLLILRFWGPKSSTNLNAEALSMSGRD